jgi:hypothetical protein
MITSNSTQKRIVVVIALCAILLTSTLAQAQKQPPLLKSESEAEKAYVDKELKEYDQNETSDPDKAKINRNKLIYTGVEQIDIVFNQYRKNSRKRNDLLQFLFDLLEIAMSSTAAVINGERAKTVLNEVLTGFKGIHTAANKDFRLLEAQIIFNKMVANRANVLKAIYGKVNDDVRSYPWEKARSDLRNYFFAGTMDDALSSLNVDTGAEAKEAVKAKDDKEIELRISTPEEVKQAQTCDQDRATVFLQARDHDPTKAGPAIKKLQKALKDNLDLIPDKTAADIDALDVTGLEKIYKEIGRRFLNNPEKVQKLCDALK